MDTTLFNILNIASAGIVLFILKILPGRQVKKNRYLIFLFGLLFSHYILIHIQFKELLDLTTFPPLVLCVIISYGPSFLFYIKDYYKKKTSFFIWHIITLVSIILGIYALIWSNTFEVPQWFLSSFYMLVLLFYFGHAVYIIAHNSKDNRWPNWMLTCTIGFGGLIIFFMVEAIWINVDLESVIKAAKYTILLFNIYCLGFILLVIYQIINSPGIFAGIKLVKVYKQEISDINSTELTLITNYVINQENFLNPELSRNDIHEATGLSVHRISEIINANFKTNFNDWINTQRIKYACNLLKNNNLSIKETFYQAGFKSKSAFNNAFKKKMDMTPSQFKLDVKNQDIIMINT